jgi:hypothetical protein
MPTARHISEDAMNTGPVKSQVRDGEAQIEGMVLREEAQAWQRLPRLMEWGLIEDPHAASGGLQQTGGQMQ